MAKKRVAFKVQPPAGPSFNFDAFIQVIHLIGHISGAVHYDEQQPAAVSRVVTFKRIFFWITYVHSLLCVALELAYFAEAVRRRASLAHLLVLITCIGFLLFSVIKLSMHKLYEVVLNEILIQLKELYSERVDFRSAGEYGRHIWFLKLFSRLYIVALIVFNFGVYALSIYDFVETGHWNKMLPFYLKYWFDWRRPVVFELTFLHQIWGSLSAVTGVLLSDTLYCIIILLLSMQFEWLGKRLDANESDEQELFKSVEEHLALIDICKRFERIYSPSLLITFLGSSGILCTSLFLTIVGETSAEKIRFTMLLLIYLMNILLLCYYGSMLIDKSSNIARQVYEGPWYSNGQKYREICLMILLRGQREEKMTALKFTNVSLPCFTKVRLGFLWHMQTLF